MRMSDQSEAQGSKSPGKDESDLEQFLRRRALQLAEEATSGVLGTLDEDGHPYTSLVELVFDGDGHFWLLLSDLAEHTRNIGRDVRASLLVCDDAEDTEETLQKTRGSYRGRIVEMDHRRDDIAPRYLDVHPHAENFIDFQDFRFYRFQIERVRLVAGFGRIGWIDADEMGDVPAGDKTGGEDDLGSEDR